MDNTKKIVSFPLTVDDLNYVIDALRNQREANVDEGFKEDNLRIDALLARFRSARERHNFRIPIGDWSKDGHGQCEWFEASANKPIEDVRDAYFAAKEKLPSRICPENFTREYQDNNVPEAVLLTIQSLGGPTEDQEWGGCSRAWLAHYVAWFINQGDPTVNVVVIEQEKVPMLPFYGFDTKERHIGFMGYGMFDHLPKKN